MSERPIAQALRDIAHMLHPHESFDSLLDHIGDASIVLLGEASHGTREFYRLRSVITRRLITDLHFNAIAVEADWPDALRISRYIQHASADTSAEQALGSFQRFPRWMWRNTEVLALVRWLHMYNQSISQTTARVGFFGIDIYSLRKSMEAVIHYLERVDPAAAQRARARYSCFDHLAEDPQRYGYATTFGMKEDCQEEVIQQLVAMTTEAERYLAQDGRAASDELFYAQQNARVAQNAESYYRAMFSGRDESWNVRDTHMLETVEALRQYIGTRNADPAHPAKLIIWAHNSHIGDARATEMGVHGQLNLGQLVRQQYDTQQTYLLGFTTHAGTVTAASDWDGHTESKLVRPSIDGSVERLFHETGLGDFFLPIRQSDAAQSLLQQRRLERAIGVIYLPHSERVSHYFHAYPARQFDALIHIDHTTAVQPLDHSDHWLHEEVPDTYPSGM